MQNVEELFTKLVRHQIPKEEINAYVFIDNISEIFCRKCQRIINIYKRNIYTIITRYYRFSTQ